MVCCYLKCILPRRKHKRNLFYPWHGPGIYVISYVQDHRQFKQRYYEFLDYYRAPNGPIFLKICGEASCNGISNDYLAVSLMSIQLHIFELNDWTFYTAYSRLSCDLTYMWMDCPIRWWQRNLVLQLFLLSIDTMERVLLLTVWRQKIYSSCHQSRLYLILLFSANIIRSAYVVILSVSVQMCAPTCSELLFLWFEGNLKCQV